MNSSEPSARRQPRAVRACSAPGCRRSVIERADLALARRLDLLGEAADRQLAEDLGQAAHAARAPAEADALAASGRRRACCPRRPPALVNIAPPGRSRLPVSTLSTSTSQLASVPNSCVQVPMRP